MADAVFAINHAFQSAAVADGNGTAMNVGGLPAVGVQVEGITTATVTFEGTIDRATWYAVQAVNVTTSATTTSTAADGLFQVSVVGLDQLRCRISGYSSGTITVSGKAVSHGGGANASVDVVDRIDRLVGKMTNYDVLASGTLGEAQATVELACAGLGTVGLGISGTWTGTIVAEVEVGDSVWDPIPLVNNSTGAAALSTTVNGNFLLGVAGALTLRIRMSVYSSGTATVYLEGSSAGNGVFLSRSIPTGVNSIGTMGLDAGTNNIGDVDVLTVPGALQGPGNPTVDSYTCAVINAAAAADQVLVAAPGTGKQIWVYGLFMMADTGAGTVTLQDDADTALSGTMAVSDEGGWVLPISGNFAMPWVKCTTNKALEADCATCTIDGILCYGIVSV